MSRHIDEKNKEEIRKLVLRPENNTCFTCSKKNPNCVIPDFAIFVCEFCAGVHRKFQHSAKGIGLSKWTKDDVKHLQEGGNERARRKWLATLIGERAKPDRTESVTSFIKQVFEQRKFYQQDAAASSPIAAPAATTTALQTPSTRPRGNSLVSDKNIRHAANASGGPAPAAAQNQQKSDDLFSFLETTTSANSAPAAKPNPAAKSSLLDLDELFGSTPSQTQGPAVASAGGYHQQQQTAYHQGYAASAAPTSTYTDPWAAANTSAAPATNYNSNNNYNNWAAPAPAPAQTADPWAAGFGASASRPVANADPWAAQQQPQQPQPQQRMHSGTDNWSAQVQQRPQPQPQPQQQYQQQYHQQQQQGYANNSWATQPQQQTYGNSGWSSSVAASDPWATAAQSATNQPQQPQWTTTAATTQKASSNPFDSFEPTAATATAPDAAFYSNPWAEPTQPTQPVQPVQVARPVQPVQPAPQQATNPAAAAVFDSLLTGIGSMKLNAVSPKPQTAQQQPIPQQQQPPSAFTTVNTNAPVNRPPAASTVSNTANPSVVAPRSRGNSNASALPVNSSTTQRHDGVETKLERISEAEADKYRWENRQTGLEMDKLRGAASTTGGSNQFKEVDPRNVSILKGSTDWF